MAKACGKIAVALGPMYSGKSTFLLDNVDARRNGGHDVVLVKFGDDNRYGADAGSTATHRGGTLRHCAPDGFLGGVRIVAATRLDDPGIADALAGKTEHAPAPTAVFLDEAQFFPDPAAAAREWALAGLDVFVAALDADFAGVPFESTAALVAVADSVAKRSACCRQCTTGATASQSIRIAEGSGERIQIGAAEKYRAACLACAAAHRAAC
jgi:thymidine kinase